MLASSTSAAAASSASSSYGASNKVAPEDTSAQDVGPKRVKQPDTLKQKIYYTFDDPSYSTAAKVISLGMMVVIVITTFSVRRHRHSAPQLAHACWVFLHHSTPSAARPPHLPSRAQFIIESELSPGGLIGPNTTAIVFFFWLEFICVVIFSIDYFGRLFTCPKARAPPPPAAPPAAPPHLCLLLHRHRRRPARLQVCPFVFGAMNLIDLAAILPFWITLIMSAAGIQGDVGLGFLRVIRLVRVFRIFKFGRYSMGVQMFAGAITNSLQPLGILAFMFAIAMIILGSIMNIFESAVDG